MIIQMNPRTKKIVLLLWLWVLFPWRIATANLGGASNVVFYEELAEAFIDGHTYLNRRPVPGLLALSDPWDPVANKSFRLGYYDSVSKRFIRGCHDLGLYKDNRFYLQWGPVPALVLVPIKLLKKVISFEIPFGNIALVAVTLAQFLLATSVFMMTVPRGSDPPPLLIIITLFTLCLAPPWSVILSRVAIYEFAIAFAQLFCALFIFAICLAFKRALEGKRQPWLLSVAGFSLGLAVGSRFNMVFVSLLLPFILVGWCRIQPRLTLKQAIVDSFALGLPTLLCIGGVFYYNYIRFENILEFGQSWQVGLVNRPGHTSFRFLNPIRILPNLYYNFLSAPVLLAHFPYLHPSIPIPPSWMSTSFDYPRESNGGLFVFAPISMIVLTIPFLWQRIRKVTGEIWFTGMGLALLSWGTALSLAIPYLFAPVTMRYIADWTLLWLTSALATASLMLQASRFWPQQIRKTVYILIVLATIWITVLGISYTFDVTYR